MWYFIASQDTTLSIYDKEIEYEVVESTALLQPYFAVLRISVQAVWGAVKVFSCSITPVQGRV